MSITKGFIDECAVSVSPCGDGQTEKTHGGKMGVEERGSFGVGFCRGHDCVIDIGVSSRELKLKRINSENLISMRLKLRSNYG